MADTGVHVASPPALPSWLPRVAASVGSVAVLSSLLFYFGWVHTAAQAKYFGLDSTFYDLSSAEYTLRSVGAALPSFAAGTLLMTLVFLGVDALDRHLTSSERRHAVVVSTISAGSILLVIGVVALILSGSSLTVWPAVLLLVGASLAGTGLVLSVRTVAPMLYSLFCCWRSSAPSTR